MILAETTVLEVLFWSAALLVAYTYLLYPIGTAVAARLRPLPLRQSRFEGSVSIVISAYNEERNIERRLTELTALLAASARQGEIVVVSDGSTDRTAELARTFRGGPIHVLDLPANVGKASALSQGCAAAVGDVIVFADARQSWAADALEKLLRNFADLDVGAVSGDLVLESSPGVMAGVSLYWRYEKMIRHAEGRLHSTVGVTGAISAVRRRLFRPIPARTVLDDVYWPLRVVMQGYRVVHDREARAFDRLPEKAGDEFRRKVRTLSGNFQLVARLPRALVPWRNPIWFQFLSHKLLRLLVPWALLTMLVCTALLPGPLYRVLLSMQLWGYALGLLGTWTAAGRRCRPASAAASFLVLNTAAWLAFWVWVRGRAAGSWSKVLYEMAPASELTPGEP